MQRHAVPGSSRFRLEAIACAGLALARTPVSPAQQPAEEEAGAEDASPLLAPAPLALDQPSQPVNAKGAKLAAAAATLRTQQQQQVAAEATALAQPAEAAQALGEEHPCEQPAPEACTPEPDLRQASSPAPEEPAPAAQPSPPVAVPREHLASPLAEPVSARPAPAAAGDEAAFAARPKLAMSPSPQAAPSLAAEAAPAAVPVQLDLANSTTDEVHAPTSAAAPAAAAEAHAVHEQTQLCERSEATSAEVPDAAPVFAPDDGAEEQPPTTAEAATPGAPAVVDAAAVDEGLQEQQQQQEGSEDVAGAGADEEAPAVGEEEQQQQQHESPTMSCNPLAAPHTTAATPGFASLTRFSHSPAMRCMGCPARVGAARTHTLHSLTTRSPLHPPQRRTQQLEQQPAVRWHSRAPHAAVSQSAPAARLHLWWRQDRLLSCVCWDCHPRVCRHAARRAAAPG